MDEKHRIKVIIATGAGTQEMLLQPSEAVAQIQQLGHMWVFADGKAPVPANQINEAHLSKVSVVQVLPGLKGCYRCGNRILVIGAGGIGGNLVERLCRAVAFTGYDHEINLTIMDGDLVEERNLPHQPFSVRDVGKPKVEAIAKNLKRIGITRKRGVNFVPIAEDFSSDTDLSDYDLVVVAVDREEPRRLVREKASAWLDLRATGDGLLLLSHEAPKSLVESIPSDESAPPASCQRPGAIESGNIQFGFSEAASHGAEWIVQRLNGRKVPSNRMYYINLGQKSFPRIAGGVGE